MALVVFLGVGLAVTPAGAAVTTQEFPYNTENRTCSSRTSSSGVYKFDYCLSVGFVHEHPRRHVGQVTMACRTVAGDRLVNCKSMTNNLARLWAHRTGYPPVVHSVWDDSVPNVSRYVSHMTPSFNCRDSPYHATDVTATLSVRFPDNTTVTGIWAAMENDEYEGCF